MSAFSPVQASKGAPSPLPGLSPWAQMPFGAAGLPPKALTAHVQVRLANCVPAGQAVKPAGRTAMLKL